MKVKELKDLLSKLNDNEPVVAFVHDDFKVFGVAATLRARIGSDMSLTKRLVLSVDISSEDDKASLITFRSLS